MPTQQPASLTPPNASTFSREFNNKFGEPIENVLNLDTWHAGADLALLLETVRPAVADAVAQQQRSRQPIREHVLKRLSRSTDPYLPPSAGLYTMTPEQIAFVQKGLLFNGGVECCDGTIVAHTSLVLSIVQIGLSLVAYQGNAGTWVQRLYQRDLRSTEIDPVAEAIALLQSRGHQQSDSEEAPGAMSRLVRRALMDYAERAALVHLSKAVWRMGQGNPVPMSVLLPASPELLRQSLVTLRKLILDHRRFVFVVSEPADRLLLTIGDALHPNEFAVCDSLRAQFTDRRLEDIQRAQSGHPAENRLVRDFIDEVTPQIAIGVYRAGEHAPARVFYSHRDHVCEAAAIAIADSLLQPLRGFPMLVDLAHAVVTHVFDGASFRGTIYDAYAAAGEPGRYLGERETRS